MIVECWRGRQHQPGDDLGNILEKKPKIRFISLEELNTKNAQLDLFK